MGRWRVSTWEFNEVSSKELCEQALQLFKDAGGWPQTEHKGLGFAATERRGAPTTTWLDAK